MDKSEKDSEEGRYPFRANWGAPSLF